MYLEKCKLVNILPLSQKFDLNDLIFLHKVLNNLIPVSLPDYISFYQGGSRLRQCHLDSFSLVSSITPRLSQNVNFSNKSRNPLSKSFFYRTHILWNTLPLEVRQITSPCLFKSEVIKHLWKELLVDDLNLTPSDQFDSSWPSHLAHPHFTSQHSCKIYHVTIWVSEFWINFGI